MVTIRMIIDKLLKFLKLAMAAIAICVLAIVLTVYFTVASCMNDFSFFSKSVLHPINSSPKDYESAEIKGTTKQSFYIPCSDGSKMHALFFKNLHSDQLLLVNHGAGGNLLGRMYIAEAAEKAGCSTLLYDYRGYALSTGSFNLDTILEDGLTAYDYATKVLKYPADKIIICGESIGSAVAAQTATQRKCARVLMLCGVTRLSVAARKIFPIMWIYPDFAFAKNKINNSETIKLVHAPLLFIHGAKDEQVPYQCSEEMFARASEPKKIVILPNSSHNDLGTADIQSFQRAICDFLKPQ